VPHLLQSAYIFAESIQCCSTNLSNQPWHTIDQPSTDSELPKLQVVAVVEISQGNFATHLKEPRSVTQLKREDIESIVKLGGYVGAVLSVLFLMVKIFALVASIETQEYREFMYESMYNIMLMLPFLVVLVPCGLLVLWLLGGAGRLMNRPLPPTIAFKLNVDAKARKIVCEEGGVFSGFSNDYEMRIRIPRGHERTWFRRLIGRQFFHTDLPEDAVSSLGLVKGSSRVKLTRILEEC